MSKLASSQMLSASKAQRSNLLFFPDVFHRDGNVIADSLSSLTEWGRMFFLFQSSFSKLAGGSNFQKVLRGGKSRNFLLLISTVEILVSKRFVPSMCPHTLLGPLQDFFKFSPSRCNWYWKKWQEWRDKVRHIVIWIIFCMKINYY